MIAVDLVSSLSQLRVISKYINSQLKSRVTKLHLNLSLQFVHANGVCQCHMNNVPYNVRLVVVHAEGNAQVRHGNEYNILEEGAFC